MREKQQLTARAIENMTQLKHFTQAPRPHSPSQYSTPLARSDYNGAVELPLAAKNAPWMNSNQNSARCVCYSSDLSEAPTSLTSSLQTLNEINSFDQLATKT